MAEVREIPPRGTIFADDLATLQGHADTLGVSVGALTRIAINKGIGDTTTAISGLAEGEGLVELDAAQG